MSNLKKKVCSLLIPLFFLCVGQANALVYWSPLVAIRLSSYDTYIRFESLASLSSVVLSSESATFTDMNVLDYPSLTIGLKTVNGNLSIVRAGSYSLTLNATGQAATTGTITVYCLGLGQPTSVTGASTYSYSNEVLTLTADYPLPQHIIIQWGSSTIGLYPINLLIFIVGFACFIIPLGVMFHRKPDIPTCIKLLTVSFIGFALMMFIGG